MVTVMTNNYRNCNVCHRPHTEVGPISAKGKCRQCAVNVMLRNITSVRNKRGPEYTKLLRRQFIAAAWALYQDSLTAGGRGDPLVILAEKVANL